jgi:hypothetical protein
MIPGKTRHLIGQIIGLLISGQLAGLTGSAATAQSMLRIDTFKRPIHKTGSPLLPQAITDASPGMFSRQIALMSGSNDNKSNETSTTPAGSTLIADTSERAKKLNALCLLVINGKTVLDGACEYEFAKGSDDSDFFRDDRVVIACQPNGSGPCYVTKRGVFGYLKPSSQNGATLCWNEMGSAHAQTCYVGLGRSGACWKHPRAKGIYDSITPADIKFCAWSR